MHDADLDVHAYGMDPRVLVVGGGIAGLATARALGRRDIAAEVVERVSVRSHVGAGVYLPANAVRAIGAVGLATQLAERAHRISQQRFLDQRGRELMTVELAGVWGSTVPCVALSHADLHELLAADVPVRLGTTVTKLDEQGPSVEAAFDDGSTRQYDLVVGADGVRSGCARPSSPRVGRASWGR